MRDLHTKRPAKAPQNRLKKQRKPINYRGFCRRLFRVAGAAIALTLAGVICYEVYGVLARTTFLRLERIDISPTRRLTRDEVLRLAGVKPGDDMLGLNLRGMGDDLAKNPWIGMVRVRRYFPDTLAIEITEREPVAVVNMGYLYYLDANGELFKTLNEGDRLDYPVITGISDDDLSRDPAGARAAFATGLDLIALLQKGTVLGLEDISEIHYDKGFGFTLFTGRGGVPIRLGNGNFADKLGRFARIYADIRGQMPTVQYIDLDYADKIIVKKA
jgi:cell division septal protein FtsQ